MIDLGEFMIEVVEDLGYSISSNTSDHNWVNFEVEASRADQGFILDELDDAVYNKTGEFYEIEVGGTSRQGVIEVQCYIGK